MVEGSQIDYGGHDTTLSVVINEVVEFDKVIGMVLDYAIEDGETLVIVTADHETGGVTRMPRGNYKWLIGSHTGADVPFFVYGADSVIANDETAKNTDIPDRAVAYMTNNEQVFPCPLAYLDK